MINCPLCNAILHRRKGKNGEFYGCSRFPSCRFACDKKNYSGFVCFYCKEFYETDPCWILHSNGWKSLCKDCFDEFPLAMCKDYELPSSLDDYDEKNELEILKKHVNEISTDQYFKDLEKTKSDYNSIWNIAYSYTCKDCKYFASNPMTIWGYCSLFVDEKSGKNSEYDNPCEKFIEKPDPYIKEGSDPHLYD